MEKGVNRAVMSSYYIQIKLPMRSDCMVNYAVQLPVADCCSHEILQDDTHIRVITRYTLTHRKGQLRLD